MKKIIFLIFMIVLFSPNVYAAEFTMNSYTSATNGGTKNRYRATEIYNSGTSNVYTFGTRYNGRISDIETYFDYPFVENTTYRLTYNMATDDFRNNFDGAYWWDCDDSTQVNPYRVSVSYISYKKIQVSFRPTANTTCIRMWVKSSNLASVAITGVSNWSLTNITIYDPDWQSGSGSGQGTSSPTPTPTTGASNQDIINSNNENTEDIINNNNQNTDDIIENNNQNTQDIINNQNELLGDKCSNLMNLPTLSLTRSGTRNYTYTLPTTLSAGTYTLSYNYFSENNPTTNVELYLLSDLNTYKTINLSNSGTNTFTINHSFDTMNFLITSGSASNSSVTLSNLMLVNGSTSHTYCEYGSFQSKLDGTNDAINNVNDSINNDNIDSGVGSDFFDSFTNNMHGLSSIITLPLSTIQSLTNSQCTPLTLPIPFTGKNITLPCMTEIYQQHVPTLLTLLRTCWLGIISYMALVDIFAMVKGFKDPDSDKIEVMEL